MVKLEGHDFPDDLYYHKDHMWLRVEGDKVRVGYNAWAADAAGKLVSIKTRPPGKKVKAGKTLGSIESGKWVGSLKVPVSGTIDEINPELSGKPNIINDGPYGDGWIAVITPSELNTELSELMKGSDKDTLEAWLTEEKAKTA
ncbi:MAG: glycine cleavage system protein H [Candidatus Bathyarchaeota archaeon]|nr:glycine cleavage system protein H [Candidatus Bathyarchaeota archaeon]